MGEINNRMTWSQLQKSFPDEWVALADYTEDDNADEEDLEGVVVVHHPDRKAFHEKLGKVLPEYGDVAVRFTGDTIKNPEIPLLWQISDTE
jgi:hypothetical protein